MYLRSTNIQRTLATAAGVLTGMYPPAAPENGGAAGGGAEVAEPVVIEVASEEEETLHPNVHGCPGLRTRFRDTRKTNRTGSKPRGQEDLESKVREETGHPDDARVDFKHVLDVVRSKLAHGKPVPAGLVREGGSDALREVEKLAVGHMMRLVADVTPHRVEVRPDDIKLTSGVLLSDTLQNIDAAVGGAAKKFILFSGHDLTLVPLLGIFGGMDGLGWPPFCAHMAVELYEEDGGGGWFVGLRFQGRPLLIGGREIVPLGEYRELLGPHLATADREECRDTAYEGRAVTLKEANHEL
mmetsp:Transcript_58793/g.187662  ORF Transcript_58793/g.187662 Transcript_58793/m.187662 type:complete len:298 (-) Transcript_58793:29-922(-)